MRVIYGENFEEDIQINRVLLDDECERHASMYAYYAEQYADARAEKDKEKDKLDFILSERELYLRSNPPDGIKITESVVSALVSVDDKVVAQKEVYRVACQKLYTLDAAMGALDHRKAQLDNLVQLWVKSYYSNVKSIGENEGVAQDIRQRLNNR